MKRIFKKIGLFIALCLSFTSLFNVGCGAFEPDLSGKIQEFYDTVVISQGCLDAYADDIYENWHDAIYEDEFWGDINLAIAAAKRDNAANILTIEENDEKISSLYKEIRESEFKDEIKDVMSAYSDYYEFVINVSGSYNSFSASKETLKKELASALKDLHMEI